jgi:hypothetical protein
MDEIWYYALGNERKGPVAFSELVRLTSSGVITPNSLVWKKGMAEWVAAKAAPGLFDSPPTIPPAIPRPQDSTAIAPSPLLTVACLTGTLGGFCLSALAGKVISPKLFEIAAIPLGAAAIVTVVFGCIFVYKSWSCLPLDRRNTTPGKAVGFLFIPIFNLYWPFVAVYGLSKQTNQALRSKALKEFAPERLGLALSVVFVVSYASQLLLFTGFRGLMGVCFLVLMLMQPILPGLFGLWVHKQASATHELLGAIDPVKKRGPWVIGLVATSSVFAVLMIAITVGGLTNASDNGSYGDPRITDPELRRQSEENDRLSESLQNQSRAFSGQPIRWKGPPENSADAAFRARVESDAAANRRLRQDLNALNRSYDH